MPAERDTHCSPPPPNCRCLCCGSVSSWLAYIGAGIAAAGTLGVNLTPLLAIGGASSLVIGLATQQVRCAVWHAATVVGGLEDGGGRLEQVLLLVLCEDVGDDLHQQAPACKYHPHPDARFLHQPIGCLLP